MSYNRPPSSPPSSDRRPPSGRAYDSYDRDYRSSSRSNAPSSRYHTSSSRSGSPSYHSNSYRDDDTRYSTATRPHSSSRPSSPSSPSQGSGRRPPSGSNGHNRSSHSNKRRKRRRSPLAALLLPVVLIIALVALLIVGLKSCLLPGNGSDAGDYSLEVSAQTIVVGGTATAEVAGLPEDFDGEITWGSSDNEVVKVNDGKLTAKKVGTATISASVNGKNVSRTVKVVETVEGIKSISITPDTLPMLSGKTFQLEVKVEFEQEDAPAVTPTWASSNPAVATVSKEGLVTARDVGSASITATVGNQSATCAISVEKDPNSQPAGLVDGAEPVTPDPNAQAPSGTTTIPPATNSGTSNKTGNTTTTKPGNTNTSTSGKTTSTNNNNSKPKANSLSLSQTGGHLDVGENLVLEAYASSGSTVKWSTSNSSIATVSSGGLVTATGAGTVTITATAGGVSQSCKVIVSTPAPDVPAEEPPAQ